MNKPPAFQFYASDWLGSSRILLMSAEQERGYLRLLLHMWESGYCGIPDDDNILSRLSLMGEGWFNGGCDLVRKCFVKHPEVKGLLTNQKMLKVWRNQFAWRAKSADGGRKSGQARKLRSTKAQRVVQPPYEANRQPNGQPKGNQKATLQTPVSRLQSPSPDSGLQPPSQDSVKSAAAPRCRVAPDRSDEIRSVLAHYRTHHPRWCPNATSKTKEWGIVRKLLGEGYSVADLCEAIDGCHKTPHNCGQNDRGEKYQSLGLIMRDASQVTRFIENNRKIASQVLSNLERQNMEAGQRWLERGNHGSE